MEVYSSVSCLFGCHWFLDHQRQQRLNDFRCSKHRRLTWIVIDRRHFDHVSPNYIDTCKSVQYRKKLSTSPPADFCSPSRWRECRLIIIRSANCPCHRRGLLSGFHTSRTSISTEMYVRVEPTRSLSFSMIPATPIWSRSRAFTIEKPHRKSLRKSPFFLATGALIPAWMEEFRMRPSSCAM